MQKKQNVKQSSITKIITEDGDLKKDVGCRERQILQGAIVLLYILMSTWRVPVKVTIFYSVMFAFISRLLSFQWDRELEWYYNHTALIIFMNTVYHFILEDNSEDISALWVRLHFPSSTLERYLYNFGSRLKSQDGIWFSRTWRRGQCSNCVCFCKWRSPKPCFGWGADEYWVH